MPRRRERVGVELDAHRVLLRAEHLHLRDAADRRDPLRQRCSRAYSSTDRQRHASRRCSTSSRIGASAGLTLRRIGGVGMRRRQRARGGGDRRLHVLRRGVDVAVERELQRDRRVAARSMSRSSNRCRRSSRTASRAASRPPTPSSPGSRPADCAVHLDGREVDVRQRVHRQQPVADRCRRSGCRS